MTLTSRKRNFQSQFQILFVAFPPNISSNRCDRRVWEVDMFRIRLHKLFFVSLYLSERFAHFKFNAQSQIWRFMLIRSYSKNQLWYSLKYNSYSASNFEHHFNVDDFYSSTMFLFPFFKNLISSQITYCVSTSLAMYMYVCRCPDVQALPSCQVYFNH